MKCNFFLFCDAANATRENKQNLLGVFTNIYSSGVPTSHASMAVAYEILDVPIITQSTLQLVISADSSGVEVFRAEQIIPTQQASVPQSIGGVFGINGLVLPVFGKYTAVIALNGEEIARNQLSVTQA